MNKTLRRVALAGLLLAPFAARPAHAQVVTPTPEGTTITNTASATWTDANGNTYSPATASVSVLVGFKAGPDVQSPVSVTPASPSTGNEIGFTILNTGNGIDSVTASTTAAAGVTITGYKIGSTTYATLAELNAALAGTPISAGTSIVVTVVYTVAPGQGGQTIPVSLTATSRRTPAVTGATDSSTTNVLPAVAAAVVVTPDGGTVDRLPSGTGPTTYTETFTVQNTGNRTDTYTLSATAGTILSIVSVNGAAGTGGSVTLSAGGSTTVDVVYTVSNSAAAGATESLVLTATSANNASVSDPGNRVIRVVRAAISMTKEVFDDNQTTAIGGPLSSDRVLPGQYIQYKVTVTNTGGAAATLTGTGFGITDALPSQVTYVSTSSDAAGWTITESSGTVSAALTGTLAPGASRFFWIRVRVK
ncbi:MAG TPA: hypothetical protein VF584_17575 [Longimicrobium sp.]|jgi:uncharacterized repeat protein (TIGR01451 family)